MANKVYRVVACIGRKRNRIYETAPFDTNDNDANMKAYRDAKRAKENYCMNLWREGYSYTKDGRYVHIGKNIEAGRVEIFLSSK